MMLPACSSLRRLRSQPVFGSGVSALREEGPIEPGDWLLRGGKERVDVFPATEPAEFELRLAFRPG
jgi:hypothetical protein